MVRTADPTRLEEPSQARPEVVLAAAVRPDALPRLGPAVRGPADDRQAGPAAAGRVAGGLDHLHALLPGDAAARLRLRARDHQGARRPPPGGAPRRPARDPAAAAGRGAGSGGG